MRPSRLWVVSTLIVSIFSSGCTKTINYDIARYQTGAPPTSQPVPETMAYEVCYADAKGKPHILGGGNRVLYKGDRVGFHTEDGVIYASTGRETFPLRPAPSKTVLWHARRKEETRLSKNLRHVAEATGAVILIGGIAFCVGAGVYYAAKYDDSDCESPDQMRK